MKKLLLLLLALVLVVGVVACADDSDDTSSTATNSNTSSGTSSAGGASSGASSSAGSTSSTSTAGSSTGGSSGASTDTSGNGSAATNTISQFVSWTGTIGDGKLLATAATDATSLQLTALNEGPQDGVAGVIGFNYEYGGTIASDDGSYDDYNILVFTYNPDTWGYTLTKSLAVGDSDKDDVEIPEDGFVIAAHKDYQEKVDAIKKLEPETVVFPHGFRATEELDTRIKSAEIAVDGSVTEDEYGKPIWEIEPSADIANYEQFAKLNVEVTAKVYMSYDEDNLYIGVVVDSPNHYLPEDQLGSLWRYDSIQVNVLSLSPTDEYFMDNNYWNYGSGTGMSAQSATDNIFRQYGFGVSDKGTDANALYVSDGKVKFGGKNVSKRDDGAQTTTYEVSIPLSECGKTGETIKGEKGTVIGVSISVNQGDKDAWKNVALRDGGGIIGLNDLTKVPTIIFD